MPSGAAAAVVAGSYERFVFAYDVDADAEDDASRLRASFSTPGHAASVRCCAAQGRLCATGGADDAVRVFDLRTRRDKGTLVHHDGTVTCLAFHGRGGGRTAAADYLVTGSSDGTLATWSASKGFERLAELSKGHAPGAGVAAVCVHPTGQMALSAADDRGIALWNMALGKPAYKGKLSSYACAPSFLRFTSDCEGYAGVAGAAAHFHAVERGEAPLASADLSADCARLLCADLAECSGGDVCLVGGEGGFLGAVDARSAAPALRVPRAHASRVRGVAAVVDEAEESGFPLPRLVATGATDGAVRLWDLRMVGGGKKGGAPSSARPAGVLAEADTGARLTCVCASGAVRAAERAEGAAAAPGGDGKGAGKRKRK